MNLFAPQRAVYQFIIQTYTETKHYIFCIQFHRQNHQHFNQLS